MSAAMLDSIHAAASKRCQCGHPRCSIEQAHRDLNAAADAFAELIDVAKHAKRVMESGVDPANAIERIEAILARIEP